MLVTIHHRGRGKASGMEIDARFFVVYTLREGKVARVDEFRELGERPRSRRVVGVAAEP